MSGIRVDLELGEASEGEVVVAAEEAEGVVVPLVTAVKEDGVKVMEDMDLVMVVMITAKVMEVMITAKVITAAVVMTTTAILSRVVAGVPTVAMETTVATAVAATTTAVVVVVMITGTMTRARAANKAAMVKLRLVEVGPVLVLVVDITLTVDKRRLSSLWVRSQQLKLKNRSSLKLRSLQLEVPRSALVYLLIL